MTSTSSQCARADQLFETSLEEKLATEDRRWLDEHLANCPQCLAVAEAMKGEGDLWAQLDDNVDAVDVPAEAQHQILSHMSGEPVSALSLSQALRTIIAVGGLAGISVVALALGLRPDLGEQPTAHVFLPVVILAAGFALGLAFFDGSGAKRALGVTFSVGVVGVVVFFVASLAMNPTAHSMTNGAFVDAVKCNGVGLVLAFLCVSPAVVVARRRMAGPPRAAAVALGLLGGALAVSALHIHCAMVAQAHLLLGHGLVFAFGIAIALLLRRVRRFS